MRLLPKFGDYQPTYPPMRSEWIPDGDAGIAATIAKMKTLMHGPQGIRSFTVRQATLEAVRGVDRGQREIDAIFYWVQRNIEFRGEHGETLQSPEATINLGAGDCDDQAMLEAAMLESLDYQTRFKTVAISGSDQFSHVYTEVRDKRSGEWIPLDPTVQQAYPGWEPDGIVRAESYQNSSDSGLGAVLMGLAAACCFL